MSADDQLQQIREEQARRFQQQNPTSPTQQPPQPAVPNPGPTNTATEVDQEPQAPQQQQQQQQQQPRRDLIGLPGSDANLTQAEIEQRQRAAEKNRELDQHNASYEETATHDDGGVRAPAQGDQPRRVRMVDDWRVGNEGTEEMPDLSDMLREAQAEMRAMGIDLESDFASMSDDIEREIDARLAADGAVPDAAGNVLQIFDAQGRDMVDPSGPDAEAMDPQGGAAQGRRQVDPRVFDNYSVQSKLENAAALPAEHKSCAICQDELQNGEDIRRLKCFHVFHRDCVDQWLHREPKCPVCKMQFEEGSVAPSNEPKGPA